MKERIQLSLTKAEAEQLYEDLLVREGLAPSPNNEHRLSYWKRHETIGEKLEKVIYDSEVHYPQKKKKR